MFPLRIRERFCIITRHHEPNRYPHRSQVWIKSEENAIEGKVLSGKYKIQELIASGGMGAVYKGIHIDLDRPVAIKILHAHMGADTAFIKRFQREARAMARLDHPNIIQVFDVAEDHGLHYIVMEYFPGKDLKHLLLERGCFTASEMIPMAASMASALAYAHAHGIVHRDIKSANIMIHNDGRIKVADFGIAAATDEASVTMTGQIMGTPEYMSPEQARGESVDARTDLYSLGILMYEMLNGKTQFHGLSKMSILAKLVQEKEESAPLFPSDTPDSLQKLIAALIKKNPNDRITNAQLLLEQIKDIEIARTEKTYSPSEYNEGGETVALTGGPKTILRPKTVLPHSPRPVPWIAITFGVLAVGGGIVYYFFKSQTDSPQPIVSTTIPSTTTLVPMDTTQVLLDEMGQKKEDVRVVQERLTQSRQSADEVGAQASKTYQEALTFSQNGQTAMQSADDWIAKKQWGEARIALGNAQSDFNQAVELFDQARETVMAQNTQIQQIQKEEDSLLREIERRKAEIRRVQNQLETSRKDVEKAGAKGSKTYNEAMALSKNGQKAQQSAEGFMRKKQLKEAKAALEKSKTFFSDAVNLFDQARQQAFQQALQQAEAKRVEQSQLEQSKKKEQEKRLRDEAEAKQMAEQEKRLGDEIEEKQKEIRALQVQVAQARKKAEDMELQEQESYHEAIALSDQSRQLVQSGTSLSANKQWRESKTALDEAMDRYRQAIKRFSEAEEEGKNKQGNDKQQIEALLARFKTAYENRDMATLKQITVMSKANMALMEQIFSHYSVATISISAPSIQGKSASAVVTITKLVDPQGNLVIPGEGWKVSRLTIPKNGMTWGPLRW